jgi:hypothetical protein
LTEKINMNESINDIIYYMFFIIFIVTVLHSILYNSRNKKIIYLRHFLEYKYFEFFLWLRRFKEKIKKYRRKIINYKNKIINKGKEK